MKLTRLFLVTSCLAASLCFAPLKGQGCERVPMASSYGSYTMLMVYWYTEDGDVADLEAYVQEGGIFVDGFFKGNIDVNNQIISPLGVAIGFVSVAPLSGGQ